MGAASILALTMGGLAAVQGVNNAETQRKQQLRNAQVATDNAQVQRQQAEMERHKGLEEQTRIDKEREALRREYDTQRARSTSLMAASNVDLTSGSAHDALTGQGDDFAAAMGDKRFDQALSRWQTTENMKQRLHEADQYDAQSSWLRNTAGNFGQSLLTGALQGASTGLGFYSSAGMAQAPGRAATNVAKQAANWSKVTHSLSRIAKKP